MNTYKPASYPRFSLFGLTAILISPRNRAIDTTTSFRKEGAMKEASVLVGASGTEWLERFDRPAKDSPEAFDPIAGKSAEDIQAIRKETISAIHENQTALAETRNAIIHTIANRPLDSGTKSAILADLDARFSRLRRNLSQKEGELEKCNAALSKIFTRRSSDKRADG